MKQNMRNKILLGLILLLLGSCKGDPREQVKNSDAVIKTADVQRFKKELESLNETKRIAVSIKDSSRIIYANEEDVLNLENGIVLFGWPSCPWFRNAVEPLLEFAHEENASIYYLDIHDIRDKKEWKEDQVVTTEEGTTGYQSILKKFHDILNPYKGLAEDSIKRISSPTVLYIEKGKGVHKVVSTVTSQTDPYVTLNEEQRQELKQRYKQYFVNEKD
jgi:hypothetical protein